jgi:hypothetical protein
MTTPAYPAARAVSSRVHAHFSRHAALARERGRDVLAPEPALDAIEAVIDAAFWASLRREEGVTPKISLALVPPELAGEPLTFEARLPLQPAALARLAPAVERPGIHLGVWNGGAPLGVWGTTRSLPPLCFVIEVVASGLLVVKQSREAFGKFVNVAVLEGDEIKLVDEGGVDVPDCPGLLRSLLDFDSTGPARSSVNVFVQLAASMRAHGRGGTLLVVPAGHRDWQESIVSPVLYAVNPPFRQIAALMDLEPAARLGHEWQEDFRRAVDAAAGLTAVDGATVMTDRHEVLAFGAKISRRRGHTPVERVTITEPIEGRPVTTTSPTLLGGTRHFSAAQFVHDQRDAMALVASQDGRFTIFKWSPCEEMVHAHRVEALLL